MTEASVTPAPGRGARAAALAGAAFAVALALALYLPWEHRPWDILDFSEFLPLLRGAGGFGERLAALTRYYAGEHGRLNVAAYAALAAKWTWLGDAPVRWQWLRFEEMLAITGGVYLLARRFGATRLGAWCGALLFVSGHAAVEAWMRQTMGEPLGLLLLLAAALAASHPGARWDRWRGPLVAALTGAAILSKEMLIVAVPLVIAAAALRDGEGRLAWRRPARRGWLTTAWCAGAVLVTGIAVVWTARRGAAQGFSASYGADGISLGHLAGNLALGILPAGWHSGWGAFLLPANIAWLGVLVFGIRAGLRRPERRPQVWMLAGLALLLPVLGAIAYLPWPYFNLFYALPWLVGPALLLAECVTDLQTGSGWERVAAGAGMAVLIGFTAATAGRTARAIALRQEVNGALARLLPDYAGASGIVVAEPDVAQQSWQGTGPTLVRYVIASGKADSLPPARDVACAAVADAVRRPGRWIVVSYSDRCGRLTQATRRLIGVYHYVDWFRPGIVTDSLEADLLDQRTP